MNCYYEKPSQKDLLESMDWRAINEEYLDFKWNISILLNNQITKVYIVWYKQIRRAY